MTNTKCSVDCEAPAFVTRSCTMRNCDIVSAVPPDFDVTMNSVRARSRRAEQRRDGDRIDVVEHVQPRLSAARVVAEQFQRWRAERGTQRDRTERRSTDAEHDDVAVAACAHARRTRLTARAARVVDGRSRKPSVPSRAALSRPAAHARERARRFKPFGVGDAVGNGVAIMFV